MMIWLCLLACTEPATNAGQTPSTVIDYVDPMVDTAVGVTDTPDLYETSETMPPSETTSSFGTSTFNEPAISFEATSVCNLTYVQPELMLEIVDTNTIEVTHIGITADSCTSFVSSFQIQGSSVNMVYEAMNTGKSCDACFWTLVSEVVVASPGTYVVKSEGLSAEIVVP